MTGYQLKYGTGNVLSVSQSIWQPWWVFWQPWWVHDQDWVLICTCKFIWRPIQAWNSIFKACETNSKHKHSWSASQVSAFLWMAGICFCKQTPMLMDFPVPVGVLWHHWAERGSRSLMYPTESEGLIQVTMEISSSCSLLLTVWCCIWSCLNEDDFLGLTSYLFLKSVHSWALKGRFFFLRIYACFRALGCSPGSSHCDKTANLSMTLSCHQNLLVEQKFKHVASYLIKEVYFLNEWPWLRHFQISSENVFCLLFHFARQLGRDFWVYVFPTWLTDILQLPTCSEIPKP